MQSAVAAHDSGKLRAFFLKKKKHSANTLLHHRLLMKVLDTPSGVELINNIIVENKAAWRVLESRVFDLFLTTNERVCFEINNARLKGVKEDELETCGEKLKMFNNPRARIDYLGLATLKAMLCGAEEKAPQSKQAD